MNQKALLRSSTTLSVGALVCSLAVTSSAQTYYSPASGMPGGVGTHITDTYALNGAQYPVWSEFNVGAVSFTVQYPSASRPWNLWVVPVRVKKGVRNSFSAYMQGYPKIHSGTSDGTCAQVVVVKLDGTGVLATGGTCAYATAQLFDLGYIDIPSGSLDYTGSVAVVYPYQLAAQTYSAYVQSIKVSY